MMIPVCRTPFLQDVTIALGRRSLKSVRYSNPTLKFEVTEEEIDGVSFERLNIEARSSSGSMTKIALWNDGVSWVYQRERNKTPVTFETHADLAGITVDDVAELIRSTLLDLTSVQPVWLKHAIPSRK